LLSLFTYWEAGVPVKYHESFVILLLMISFIFAAITWRYIEQPFRSKRKINFRAALATIIFTQLILLGYGTAVAQLDGVDSCLKAYQRAYLESKSDRNPLRKSCHYSANNYLSEKLNTDGCIFSKKNKPSFFVWGDSHADAITPLFLKMGEDYNISGVQSSLSGGAALLETVREEQKSSWNDKWNLHKKDIIELLKKSGTIQNIFLVARWDAYYLDRPDYEKNLGAEQLITSCVKKQCSKKEAFEIGLEKTVSTLTKLGKRVWIVLQVPLADRNVPRHKRQLKPLTL